MARRNLPLAYGIAAMVALLLLLPTALRPPPDETPASASFSPDAPPADDPDVIVQTLEQARSQTAGGIKSGDDDEGAAVTTTTTTVPAPRVVRTKGSCFGDPARQVESPYSTSCVELWQGDNGGSTSMGVDADEIRIAIWETGNAPRYRGRVPDVPADNENNNERMYRVIQQYFNENFEFYGRKFQLISDKGTGDLTTPPDAAGDRAHVAATIETYDGVFAGWANSATILRPAADHGVVGIGGWQLDHDLYSENAPYLYAWEMDGSQVKRLTVEYICKRLDGHVARWAGDVRTRSLDRKFGVLYEDVERGWQDVAELAKQRCGAEVFPFEMQRTPGEEMATAFATFRLEDVTTVVVATNPISPAAYTNYATGQGYFPEWFIPATWQVDQPSIPGLFGYDMDQWKHAFGITAREFESLTPGDADWQRAYKTVDPNGEWHGPGLYSFRHLLQLANGIQAAGPNLTPETFRQGLLSMPQRTPNSPPEAMCCGYTEANLSYADVVAEIFFVTDEFSSDVTRGTYVYPDCGKRYGEGQIPTGEPDMFNGGCLTPNDGRAYPSQGGDPGLYGGGS